MKRLYFVRHGQSKLNAQRLFAGSTDTPLTDIGRHQAAAAAQLLKATRIDLIVSSPLSRAFETAHIIAAVIAYPTESIITNDLFTEQSFGVLEGKPWDDYDGITLDFATISGAETTAAVRERAGRAYEFLCALNAQTILLVGHGSFAHALQHAIRPDADSRASEELKNGQLLQLL